jgi:hypothetical protein
MKMTATEQAIAALRSAAGFADYIAEASGDEDALALHRQCTEAIRALNKEESRRLAVEMNKEETLCVTV